MKALKNLFYVEDCFFLQLTEYFEQMVCSSLHPIHKIIHHDTDMLYL